VETEERVEVGRCRARRERRERTEGSKLMARMKMEKRIGMPNRLYGRSVILGINGVFVGMEQKM